MKVENPIAFNFIMQDEIYLLENDKIAYDAMEAVPAAESPPVNFGFLGGNRKNFLIIVHYPDVEFIAGTHLTALENILKRLELSMGDIAIFNLANYPDTNFSQLATFFNPRKLLFLGAKALPAGMEIPALNTPKQLNGCNSLFSFSFDEMMENNDLKKAFWDQMKLL